MPELVKPDLARILEHYGADVSRLSRIGWSRHKVRCVVHDDHNPSMSVNLGTGKVHCWSCDMSGDGYDIIMRKEGLGFSEAKQWAADNLGIEGTEVRSTSDGGKPGRWVPPWVAQND